MRIIFLLGQNHTSLDSIDMHARTHARTRTHARSISLHAYVDKRRPENLLSTKLCSISVSCPVIERKSYLQLLISSDNLFHQLVIQIIGVVKTITAIGSL